MTNEIIRLIKNYLNDFTIETTPNIYNKYQRFSNLLEKKHKIYVTYLPDENSNNVIDIPLNGDYIAFYVPLRNQYMINEMIPTCLMLMILMKKLCKFYLRVHLWKKEL